ncbi:AI-2E family transporter [uncultured Umboniibacter sp.]|uniref:AI-2E family transporter n=1 Tax=uncultured Umboniibacter sp. TaxID=1798917 RepID=UPI00262A42F0|nr:AI-2E family transporter [uncultured Umboniibacter sp.]
MSFVGHIKSWFDRVFAEEEALTIVALLLLAIVIMSYLGSFIAPLLAAVVISFLLDSFVKLLTKLGLARGYAVYIVYAAFVGVMVSLVFVLFPEIWRQLSSLFNAAPAIVGELQTGAIHLSEQYPQYLSRTHLDEMFSSASGEVGKLTQKALAYSVSGLQGVMTVAIYLVLVPILVFFMLRDQSAIGTWFEGFLPSRRSRLTSIWGEFIAQCGNYARGKVVEIVVVGMVSFITFSVLGLSYAALLGFLVGVSVIIPFLGAAVVTLPVMLVGYFQWGVSTELLVLFVSYSIIQFLDGNVLVPLLFSEAVKIHPVGIIAAVLIFGGLWGVWGVFFAIPLATLIKALINSWPSMAKQTTKESS